MEASMTRKGTVIFNRSKCGWQGKANLQDVTSGKSYPATMYGAHEEDDRGNEGCGCAYIVFHDDVGDRVGFGWSTSDGVVDGGVVFTEDKQS
jgi:hypothetical protein